MKASKKPSSPSPAPVQKVIIQHPRTPYKAVVAAPVNEGEPICIIELTGGFFRILHMRSGMTLTDTDGITAANRFVTAVNAKYLRDKRFAELLDTVSMPQPCKGAADPNRAIYNRLKEALELYSSAVDNVSFNATKNERYIYPPEFL